MGYTFSSLSRILDQESMFRGKKILTLGTLYPYVSRRQAEPLRSRGLNVDVPNEQFSRHLFVERLGALSCHSLDVSDYQQSEIICNLNHPMPPKYGGQYDVVFDGGTLEHLANLPTALVNIFGLLRESGIYYFGVPCNNWSNHGFFQFSPTFFADLCIDNPQLKLLALHVATNKHYYDWASQNAAFMRALLNSRHRIVVGGIIQKNGEGINFDLTQTKYRKQHAAAQASPSSNVARDTDGGVVPRASTSRRLAISAIHRFADSVWISLRTKEVVFNTLYRLIRKLRTRRST